MQSSLQSTEARKYYRSIKESWVWKTLCCRRLASNAFLKDLMIVSAVRTPWTNYQYPMQELVPRILRNAVVETALKQAGANPELVQVYIAEKSADSEHEKVRPCFEKSMNGSQFKELLYTPVEDNFIKRNCLSAAGEILTKSDSMILVGSIHSNNNFHKPDIKVENNCNEKQILEKFKIPLGEYDAYRYRRKINFDKAHKDNIFDPELVFIRSERLYKTPSRSQKAVDSVDNQKTSIINECKASASAVLLTPKNTAHKYKLKPLASIVDLLVEEHLDDDIATNALNTAQKVLQRNDIYPGSIHQWLIEDKYISVPLALEKNLQIDRKSVNPYGSPWACNATTSSTILPMLIHGTHILKPLQKACLIFSTHSNYSTALVLEKLLPFSTEVASDVAQLTLYTKTSCPLCDEMVDALQKYFKDEYQLKMVYIDNKDEMNQNSTLMLLYRYDIPVLFLNGQFICMHRLNVPLLRRRLNQFKEIKNQIRNVETRQVIHKHP